MWNNVPPNGFPQIKGGGDSGDISELEIAVEALESTVGDSESGLVKDVDDLETAVGELESTVGDSESGVVKDVTDLQNANKYLTTETLVGKWGSSNLYRKVINVAELPNNSTAEITLGVSGYTIRKLDVYYNSDSEAGNMLMYLSDLFYTVSTDKLSIHTNTDMTSYSGTIVVEYTK